MYMEEILGKERRVHILFLFDTVSRSLKYTERYMEEGIYCKRRGGGNFIEW
jgi:hypothetical protein